MPSLRYWSSREDAPRHRRPRRHTLARSALTSASSRRAVAGTKHARIAIDDLVTQVHRLKERRQTTTMAADAEHRDRRRDAGKQLEGAGAAADRGRGRTTGRSRRAIRFSSTSRASPTRAGHEPLQPLFEGSDDEARDQRHRPGPTHRLRGWPRLVEQDGDQPVLDEVKPLGGVDVRDARSETTRVADRNQYGSGEHAVAGRPPVADPSSGRARSPGVAVATTMAASTVAVVDPARRRAARRSTCPTNGAPTMQRAPIRASGRGQATGATASPDMRARLYAAIRVKRRPRLHAAFGLGGD